MDTEELIVLYICGFDGARRGNYFEGEPIRRNEVKVRVKKLKNGNSTGKGEVTERMKMGSY